MFFFFLACFYFNLSLLLLRDKRLEDLGSNSLLAGKEGSNFFMFSNTIFVGDEEGVALSVDPFLGEERNEKIAKKGEEKERTKRRKNEEEDRKAKKANIIDKSLSELEQSNIAKGEGIASDPSLSFVVLLQNVDKGNQLFGESLSGIGLELLLTGTRAKHQRDNLNQGT